MQNAAPPASTIQERLQDPLRVLNRAVGIDLSTVFADT